MGLDLGSAPRGDPRVAHVSERYFSSLFFATHACHLILWGRGRIAGVTEIRPRKFDRDLILQVCKEQKQKRQVAFGQQPTHRIAAPDMKQDGKVAGWSRAWFKQIHYRSWSHERVGPNY